MNDFPAVQPVEPGQAEAIFAGGCFWCLQPSFDGTPGVIHTQVGYTGGDVPNPTYQQVCGKQTGHLEAIRVIYDPATVSYATLLQVFWRQIDPTQPDGQFADIGPQYQTALFYVDERQKAEAEASIKALQDGCIVNGPIATQIRPAATWYPAEEAHQQYYLKQRGHYQAYKQGSGRAAYIQRQWGGA